MIFLIIDFKDMKSYVSFIGGRLAKRLFPRFVFFFDDGYYLYTTFYSDPFTRSRVI